MKKVPVILALLMLPATLTGQMSKQDSVWLPLASLLGQWEGTGGGEPGAGRYERSYQHILGKKFIEVRNKAVYPEGETHEDMGYISFDKTRKRFVLRQFHVEGFVNQYVLDSLPGDGKSMVFRSEAIENIPAGWQARESYELPSNDELVETFELAPPGKPFEVYTRVTFKRKR